MIFLNLLFLGSRHVSAAFPETQRNIKGCPFTWPRMPYRFVGAGPRACPPLLFGTFAPHYALSFHCKLKQPHWSAAFPGTQSNIKGCPFTGPRIPYHFVGAGPRACPPLLFGTFAPTTRSPSTAS